MSLTTTKAELRRRRRLAKLRAMLIAVFVTAAACLAVFLIVYLSGGLESIDETKEAKSTTAAPTKPVETTTEEAKSEEWAAEIAEADRLAAMYDYDAAIALIQTIPGYDKSVKLTQTIGGYASARDTCVKWADNTKIPHIFFHTLVVDTELAFDGDEDSDNYNQVMTTVSEFNEILTEMYERGFVLVSIYDIASLQETEEGVKMKQNAIMLPPGKKPFILSQDDVSYYAYMTGDGYAQKLVIGEGGKVVNEYVNRDGSVSYGSYDMIPLLDDFIDEHPDFSYRGAKGIIALTGYEGVLGYRTSEYSYGANSTQNKDFKYVNPDIESDRAEAKKVADALKADGWLFACHGWGHRGMGRNQSYENFEKDIDLWYEEVIPVIGPCDILIYPKGDDIGTWRMYTDTAEGHQYPETLAKYEHADSLGFKYYCNVDSSEYWTQIGAQYVRTGRRNIDGTRLFEAVCGYRDLLSDLIDAKKVWDSARPQPVKGVPVPEGYVIY